MKDDSSRPAKQEAPRTQSEKHGIGVAIAEDPRLGVVVTGVDQGAPAAGLLDVGDVIVDVDGVPIKSVREAAERIRKAPADRPVLLRVRRDGKTRFVAIDRKAP